jgi:hypothetical protein
MRREPFEEWGRNGTPRELRPSPRSRPGPTPCERTAAPGLKRWSEGPGRRTERLARTLAILPGRGGQYRSTDRPTRHERSATSLPPPKRPENPRSRAGQLPNAEHYRGSARGSGSASNSSAPSCFFGHGRPDRTRLTSLHACSCPSHRIGRFPAGSSRPSSSAGHLRDPRSRRTAGLLPPAA